MWWTDALSDTTKEILITLKEELDKLDRCYFLDRSKFNLNPGVDNEVGKGYYSVKWFNLPQHIQGLLAEIVPKRVEGLTVEMIVVNYFTPGGYIPPHVDRDSFLQFGVIALEDGTGTFTYYVDNDLQQPVDIEDEQGQIVYTNNVMSLHSCKATKERYTIVALY